MEVPDQVGEDKFKVNDDYDFDKCRIAQWLRVIDGLNNENPVPVPEASLFARLQEKAKLSIFTEEFLASEAMNMSDRLYEMYVEKKHARAEGLAEGRAEAIDILESLGAPADLIEKARKIAAEKAKESPGKP